MDFNDDWLCIYIKHLIAKQFFLTKQTHCGECDLIPPPEYPLWVENSGSNWNETISHKSEQNNGNIVYNYIENNFFSETNWNLTK